MKVVEFLQDSERNVSYNRNFLYLTLVQVVYFRKQFWRQLRKTWIGEAVEVKINLPRQCYWQYYFYGKLNQIFV